VLLDRAFLAAHGAAAVRVTSAGHEIVTTRRPDEPRAWLQRDGPNSSGRARQPAPPQDDATRASPDADAAEPRLYQ
jgi:hypothetical protein